MRPRAVLLAGVAICAAIVLPAHAATPEAVEVARSGDVKLLAGDKEKSLCINLSSAEYDLACADDGESIANVVVGDSSEPSYLGAAVPLDAASIEVRRAGVLLGSAPTVAGEAYKGARAGSVRFAVVRLAKTEQTDGLRVRALNAAGALVEVVAADDDPEFVLGRTGLLSGKARDVRWKLVAEQVSELTPSVLDPAHETPSRCVVTTLNGVERGRDCVGAVPQPSLGSLGTPQAAGAETCNPSYRLVHGVVDGSVPAVSVLLGNGRRHTVQTVPTGDGRRTYAVSTGQNAVRSVTMPGRGVVRPALAPMSTVCAGGGQGIDFLNFGSSALGIFALFVGTPPVTPVGPVTTIAGAQNMQVADGPADTLCLAVAGKPFDALGCGIVPPRGPHGAFDNILDAHAFALAVPARVAAVRFGTVDGKVSRTVATDAGAGYRGRYAGAVRFAAASLSGIAEFARFELLDAAGRVVYSDITSDAEEDGLALPRVGAARRVAGRAGRPSLWQTNVRFVTGTEQCLTLTDGPAPGPLENCQTTRSATTVLLDASCITKRLSVAIAVKAGSRVFTDTGGRLRRQVRLHRGLAVITIPSGRPLRGLTVVRNKRRRHVEIGAPAGAKQCGWHLAPLVD